MNRSYFVRTALVAAVLLGACAEGPVSPESDSDVPVAATETSPASLAARAEPPSRQLVLFRGQAPRELATIVSEAGGSLVASYEEYGFAITTGLDEAAVNHISGLNGVEFAGAEPVIRLDRSVGSLRELTGDVVASPANPAAALGFFVQWHLRAVGAPEAWAAGLLGSSDVTLAVLDSGIDINLPDFAGLVDVSRSAAFHNRDDFIFPFYPGSPPFTDFNFHGSHVASIAASNAFIFAGVTSGTTLMAVKVCDWEGLCPLGAVFEGIAHAVDNGADVINMSLGGGFDKARPNADLEDRPPVRGLLAVINRLFNSAKRAGVTVVVAAGNDAADLDHNASVFASYCDAPHVICVAAAAPASALNVLADGPWPGSIVPSSFTNFGRSAISVSAPGGDLDLPGEDELPDSRFVDGPCATTSFFIVVAFGAVCSPFNILGVVGTSQASPHVAGLASALVAQHGRNPARIKAAIQKGTDDLGDQGTDPYFGKGFVNVPASLGVD